MINRDQLNVIYKLIDELDRLDNLVSQPDQLVAPLLPETIEEQVIRSTLAIVNERRMKIKEMLSGYSIKV